jgi:hypothetical protein
MPLFSLLPCSAATEEIGVLLAKQYVDIDRHDQSALCLTAIFNSSSCWSIIEHVKKSLAVDVSLMKQLLNRAYDTLTWNLDKKKPLLLIGEYLRLAKARNQWVANFSANDAFLCARKLLDSLEGVDRIRAECLFMEYEYECLPSTQVEKEKSSVQVAYWKLGNAQDQMLASIYLATSYQNVGFYTLAQKEREKIQSILNENTALVPHDLLLLGKLNKIFTFRFTEAVEKVKSRLSKEVSTAPLLLTLAHACIDAGLLPKAIECIQEAFDTVKTLPPCSNYRFLVFDIIVLHRTHFSTDDQDVLADVFEPIYNQLIPVERIQFAAKVLTLRNKKLEYDKATAFLTGHIKDLKEATWFKNHPEDLFDHLLSLSQSQALPQQQKQMIFSEASQLLPQLKDHAEAAIQLAGAYLEYDLEKCRQAVKICENLINLTWRLNVAVITGIALCILGGTVAIFRPSLF